MDYVEYVKQFPLQRFTRGELLIQGGEPTSCLMAIREGYIKVTAIRPDGAERLIWIAGRYDLAPLEKLFSKQGAIHFFYTALTDGEYYKVDKTAFMDKARETPELMAEIARGMSDHYDDLLQRVDAVDSLDVKSRLLATLLYIAKRFSAESTVNLIEHGLKLTHLDYANLIGSTRETTSLALKELQREKYIDYSSKYFTIFCDRIEAALS